MRVDIPDHICEYEYNALYRGDIDLTLEVVRGDACVESLYIDPIKSIWRNSQSELIYIILTRYTLFSVAIILIILRYRSR